MYDDSPGHSGDFVNGDTFERTIVIEAILFDAGDTLTRPIDGEWFPGISFRRLVAEHEVDRQLDWDRLPQALDAGMAYLSARHRLDTIEDEYDQFQVYFSRLLIDLGLRDPPASLVDSIAYETVFGLGVEPFDDVMPMLMHLRGCEIQPGIVSNSWPSLERRYEMLGLRDYFDPFIISAQVGALKPDRAIYELALATLNVNPDNVLFVDDWPEYVAAAQNLSMQGIVLARHGYPPEQPLLPWLSNLSQLLEYVGT